MKVGDPLSCFHPLVGQITYRQDGKKHVRILKPDSTSFKVENYRGDDFLLIPCGKCKGCRLDRARSWADRMMLELESNDGKGVFVTLTYRDSDLHFSEFLDLDNTVFSYPAWIRKGPDGISLQGVNPTLDVRDCQLFMKRLRKEFGDIRIRFYLAGEYGPCTLRPHYHAILFGLTLEDICSRDPETWRQCGMNDLFQPYYTNKFFEDIWSHGFVTLSEVSWNTCGYVARYCLKKLSGDAAVAYGNRVPEFSLSSRRPGIGGLYLEQHPEVFDFSKIYVPGCPDGVSLPSYFLKKLSLTDPVLFDKIKYERRFFAEAQQDLLLSQSDRNMLGLLDIQEEVKELSTSSLRRANVEVSLE